MSIRSLFLVPALALALTGCGGGQGNNLADSRTSAPNGGGADALPAARELLAATHFEQQLPAITAQMSNVMLNQMIAQNRAHGQALSPRMEAELRRVITEEMQTTMTQASPPVSEEVARVYARYFTADELRELQRLQTNPVMMKMQRIAPQFSADIAQAGMAAAARRQPEVERHVAETMARIRAEEGH